MTTGITLVGTRSNETLTGGSGDDLILTSIGSSRLEGAAGNDTLQGSDDYDQFFGGEGDDLMQANGGNDYLEDGQGSNTFEGGNGNDFIYASVGLSNELQVLRGGAGNDNLLFLSDISTGTGSLDGGEGDDTLTIGGAINATVTGGDGSDRFIVAYTGNTRNVRITDFQVGAGGDQIDVSTWLNLYGYDGANPFTTGYMRLLTSGDDTLLQFSNAADGRFVTTVTLVGVAANTLVAANFLPDFDPSGAPVAGVTLTGTQTSETLIGAGGNDLIRTEFSHSSLQGQGGDDTLQGSSGRDSIQGGYGNDLLQGNGGDDQLDDTRGSNTFEGGDGHDYINANVQLGEHRQVLFGGAGNDTLLLLTDASQGTGSVDGGEGNDILSIHSGLSATLTGGDGVDRFYVSYTGGSRDVRITDFQAGAGGDVVDLSIWLMFHTVNYDGSNPFATGHLRLLASGDDTVVQFSNDGADAYLTVATLLGVAGSTLTADNFSPRFDPSGAPPEGVTLTGTQASEVLTGSAGNDLIRTEFSDGQLQGEAGNDTLQGSEGHDVLRGGFGHDLLQANGGDDDLEDAQGSNTFEGGDGNDLINAAVLQGEYQQVLRGGAGNDTLVLQIDGSLGTGSVDGGEGDDTLNVYNGASATLTGGNGRDHLVVAYTGASRQIRVTDFQTGTGGDQIDVSEWLTTYANDYDGSNPFASRHLRLLASGDDTLVQFSHNGVDHYVTAMTLVGVAGNTLTAANFSPEFDPSEAPPAGLTVTGTQSPETLLGAGGDDLIRTEFSNARLQGEAGNDTLQGSNGDDVLVGGNGHDLLQGNGGDDHLEDTHGTNTFEGGDGNDYIDASVPQGGYLQVLRGGAGHDTLLLQTDASTGSGSVDGGEGNDAITVYSSASATLTGGNGRDRFTVAYTGASRDVRVTDFQAGTGGDLVDVSAWLTQHASGYDGSNPFASGHLRLLDSGADTLVQFSASGADGNYLTLITLVGVNAQQLTAANFSPAFGTPGNDVLDGTPAHDLLQGMGGNDTLDGGAGNDTIDGGNDPDSLSGGAGDDTILGGDGNDTLLGSTGNDSLDGGAGTDRLVLGRDANRVDLVSGTATGATEGTDHFTSIEVVDGGSGNDTLLGADGNESLLGGAGNDSVDAGDGNDTVNGGSGNDTLAGGGGNDQLNLSVDNSVVDLAAGTVTGSTEGQDRISGFEAVDGGAGNDTLRGSEGQNVLLGGFGNDLLQGNGGDDYLEDTQGSNTLDGGDGNDFINASVLQGSALQVLRGGAGNDTLLLVDSSQGSASVDGGEGDDTLNIYIYSGASATLTGGNGRDHFVVAHTGGSRQIRITDFQTGIGGDQIDVSEWLTLYANGHDGTDAFATGYLRLQASGADTLVQISTAGTANAEGDYLTLLTLVGVAVQALTSANFSPNCCTPGDDVLEGTPAQDLLQGIGGNDTLDGGTGNDMLAGGDGQDSLIGGAGDDMMMGGGGNDTLVGGTGNDSMAGEAGIDRLVLGSDANRVDLGSGTATGANDGTDLFIDIEVVDGGGGNDTLLGASANESLLGGAGNDSVDAGGGNDTVNGGSGNDTLAGGSGNDQLNLSVDHSVVDLAAGTVTGSTEGQDRISGFEAVDGGAGNDTLLGAANADTLLGGAGDDSLQGGLGNDSLQGGSGNDSVDGGEGNDELVGSDGAGDDTYTGGAGTDTVRYTSALTGITVDLGAGTAQGADIGTDRLRQIENVVGGRQGDQISGDAGNNLLDGYTGADTLLGGAGNDTYRVDHLGDRVFETTTTVSTTDAGGTDQVISTVTFSLDTDAGTRFVEHLRLDGTAAINGTGNALGNTVYASAGNNVLDGLGGTDWLSYLFASGGISITLAGTTAQNTGASGTDTIHNFENLAGSNFGDNLRGSTGANVIKGNNGNDKLTGNLGNDTLTGGTGLDTFRFDSALDGVNNADRITDFNVADDTIQLENAVFTRLLTPGTLASANFVANTAGQAVDADDHLVYDTDGGQLYYDADGSGAGAAVLVATLSAGLALTAADFVVT